MIRNSSSQFDTRNSTNLSRKSPSLQDGVCQPAKSGAVLLTRSAQGVYYVTSSTPYSVESRRVDLAVRLRLLHSVLLVLHVLGC